MKKTKAAKKKDARFFEVTVKVVVRPETLAAALKITDDDEETLVEDEVMARLDEQGWGVSDGADAIGLLGDAFRVRTVEVSQ